MFKKLTAYSRIPPSLNTLHSRGGRNRVRVHRSIYWVYGVHRDVHTRAAKVVSSLGLLQRPRRHYGDWAGYVGDSGVGEGIILSLNSISKSYCFVSKIIKVCRAHKFGVNFVNAKQILHLLSTHSYTHTTLYNAYNSINV